MAQTPRDACEAALGLGGTRWGMVTDVILPFSRNGIVGAFLLGFGRGLGETMIVVLVLSKANHLTWAIMGPNGLGSIAKEITEDFPTATPLDQSALILLGLVLFVTTLLVNLVARAIVNRGSRTDGRHRRTDPTRAPPPADRRSASTGPVPVQSGGRPTQPPKVHQRDRCCSRRAARRWPPWPWSGSIFTLAGINAPFGMLVSWFLLFFAIYGMLCWRLHGILVAKDRMATVGIWAGALSGHVHPGRGDPLRDPPRGFSAVFDDFPHFLTADMTHLGGAASITQLGVGAAIVGTVEQVGIATVLTVPLGIMTATYLVDSNGPFARLVGAVVDAMTGAPAIIAGPLRLPPVGGSPPRERQIRIRRRTGPGRHDAAHRDPGGPGGGGHRARVPREAALALGAPEWRVLVRVVLPTARAGLMTAVILGIARIAGETAPVLFNAGGLEAYNWNPFSGQQDDLPLRIYENIFQPGAVITQSAWGASFVLVCLVLILFVVARLLGSSAPGQSWFVPWTKLRKNTAVDELMNAHNDPYCPSPPTHRSTPRSRPFVTCPDPASAAEPHQPPEGLKHPCLTCSDSKPSTSPDGEPQSGDGDGARLASGRRRC